MNPESIRLFGVGGAGGRLADAARRASGGRLSAVALDTDFAALSALSSLPQDDDHKILLGGLRFARADGTAGDVSAVRMAALERAGDLGRALDGVSLAVCVAGLGGGTGSGALPVLLETARERGVRTLVFAVKPFRMEGVERLRAAAAAAQSLAALGDLRVFASNDDLAAAPDGPPDAAENAEGAAPDALGAALARATDALVAGLTLFWRLSADPGFLHLDGATLAAIAEDGRGEADFAVAAASGPGRLDAVLRALWDGPGLGLRRRAGTARAALVGVAGGEDLRLSEVGGVSRSFESGFHASFPVRLSTVLDPAFDGTLRVVALLFRRWASAEREEALADEAARRAVEPPADGAAGGTALHDAAGRRLPGRFDRVAGTFVGGENLDIPTWLRRNLRIDSN